MGYNWPRRKTPLKRTGFNRNKYNAVRCSGFGSKLEAAVFEVLKLREKSGEISDIRQQVSVDLGFGINWRVDFSFAKHVPNPNMAIRMYAEAKGVKTERYRMCLKLWRGGQGPGPLEIWEGSWQWPALVEIVTPKTKEDA